MTREDFESLSTKEKRKYIAKQINAFWAYMAYENKMYCKITGSTSWLQVHHCWYRSQAPLWYHGLFENMVILSHKVHFDIHNKGVKYLEFDDIAKKLQAEDKTFKAKYVFNSK